MIVIDSSGTLEDAASRHTGIVEASVISGGDEVVVLESREPDPEPGGGGHASLIVQQARIYTAEIIDAAGPDSPEVGDRADLMLQVAPPGRTPEGAIGGEDIGALPTGTNVTAFVVFDDRQDGWLTSPGAFHGDVPSDAPPVSASMPTPEDLWRLESLLTPPGPSFGDTPEGQVGLEGSEYANLGPGETLVPQTTVPSEG